MHYAQIRSTLRSMDKRISEWRQKVGRKIEERRVELGYSSVASFAGRAEVRVSPSTWLSLESGEAHTSPGRVVSPSAKTKHEAARALGWPPPALDWLEAGDDPSWWTFDGEWWHRRVPGQKPMGVRPFADRPPAKAEIAEDARMAMARAREAHEEAIRLKVQLEALTGRVDNHDRRLAALDAVPRKLDEVLDAIRGPGAGGGADPPRARTDPAAPRARPRKPRAG